MCVRATSHTRLKAHDYCILRADLHYGPWSRTMEDGIFRRSEFMVRLLKNLVLKALGPSLGVNQTWTKKNDHAPKSERVDCFSTCSKGQFWKEKYKSSLIILLFSLGSHLSSFLVKSVEDVACKFSHNNSYKKKWNIKFVHVTGTLCCHYIK